MIALDRRWRWLAVAIALVTATPTSWLAADGTPEAPAPRQGAFRGLQPPDGRWLVDDRGRQYFVAEIPRLEGTYRWLDETRTRVRLLHGIEFDVVSHDERHIRVKVYGPSTEAAPAAGRPSPTAEERARVAATYQVDATAGRGVDLVPFGDGLPQRGQWRNGFDVADMNGDGHLDIVFGPPRKGARVPVIFLGDGTGHWTPWTAARFPALPFDYGDAKVADLNGDGIPDLVLAIHLEGIVAMVGDGRGKFTTWSEGIDLRSPKASQAPGFAARGLVLADWNKDGRPDILALGEGPALARRPAAGAAAGAAPGSRGTVIYLNRGDGAWTAVADRNSQNYGGGLAVADFDGDGRLDFVAATDRWGFTALLNLGLADGRWKETALPGLRPNALVRAVAARDFDGDGRPDVAVGFVTQEQGAFRTGIDVLFNRPGGWQRRTLGVVQSPVTVYRLDAGDIDGDGHTDLAGVDGEGTLWIFRGDGGGAFVREAVSRPRSAEQCQGHGLRLVDLDRDGRAEIVVSLAEEMVNHGPFGKDLSCPSEGGIQVWKVVRRTDPSP